MTTQKGWDELNAKVKQRNINRKVARFIDNIKQSIPRKHVPTEVSAALDSTRNQLEDASKEGWSNERLDVMLIDLVSGCFHLVSIFLFTTRVVLSGVVMGIYPILYIGVLLISCLYQMNTQIHYSDKMLVRKTAIRS